MPSPDTDAAVSTRRDAVLAVRDAVPADYPAIRDVVIAAYRQYADLIPPDIFSVYLADLLDLDRHARHGRLLVAEADQWICAFAAWYPDASVQGVGLPPGWVSGRALAVHPAARGNGAARAIMATGERLAREAGAPVLAFHTVSFMTDAIALYERLGFCRAPEYDYDWAARKGRSAAQPIMAVAFVRRLTGTPHSQPAPEDSMTTPTPTATPTRRVSTPAYYLGRPAGLWLAALTSRSATRTSCAST